MHNSNHDIGSIYTKVNGASKLGSKAHIRSIIIGKKTIGGKETDIDAMVFNVREKKPISQLDPNKIIPKTVIYNGIEYQTDVMDFPGKYTVLTDGCWGSNIDSWSRDHKQRLRQYIPNNQNGNPQPTTPPSGTTNKPVMGGISFGQQKGGTGTLGCIVKDIGPTSNQKICALTNLHVLVEDGFYAHEKVILKQLGLRNKITNTLKKGTVQPGEPISGYSPAPYNKEKGIGFVKRYVPFYFWNWNENNELVYHNYVDAAISSLQLSTEDLSKDPQNPSAGGQLVGENYVIWTDSTKQLNMFFTDGTNQDSYPFATKEEVESLTPGTRVWKSGRTTGFVGKDECVLEIKGRVPLINVYGYMFSWYETYVTFEDIIAFGYRRPPGATSSPPAAILGGDSGSVLIADFDGTKKIVGLNFAGGPESLRAGPGSAGFACRIDRVKEELYVDSFSTKNLFWETNFVAGENDWAKLRQYFDNPKEWRFLPEGGFSDKKLFFNEQDKQVYYQCGLYKK